MSEENVEIVRRVYEAAARRDRATVLACYDPEVEWDVSRSPMARLVGEGVYHGHEGLRRFFRAYHEAWEDIEYEGADLIDADEQVVSVDTERARGRASGVETELTQYAVWTIREGKIVRAAWFGSRDEALEAAGLRE
jgi:ketosteroid isomerase-like protein